MFLAATADQRFWKKDEKILFLGEWCRPFASKPEWIGLDGEVLPYRDVNEKVLYSEYLLVHATIERCLRALQKSLNSLHKVDYPLEYWRLIVGPWLWFFVDAAYDRYTSVLCAEQSKKVTNFWVADQTKVLPAFDVNDYERLSLTDLYNQYLFQELIVFSGKLPFERRPELTLTILPEERVLFRQSFLKRSLSTFVLFLQKLVPPPFCQVVAFDSYFPKKALAHLLLSMRQVPLLLTPRTTYTSAGYKADMRKGFVFDKPHNSFDAFLNHLIPQQLPLSYVEDFHLLRQTALAAFPKKSRVICTANASISNEGFKFWAAEQVVTNNAKLVGTQHGGCYGTGLWNGFEDYERSVSHRYHSWGWTDANDKRVVPATGSKLLSSISKISGHQPDGAILWLMTTTFKYAYGFFALPAGAQIIPYFAEQAVFYRNLCPPAQKLMLVRPYPRDNGWNDRMRLADAMPELSFADSSESFYASLARCRLAVSAYNATVHLETMAANFPTVLFCNPHFFALRDEAISYHEELKKVGILHETPEAAAAHINKIFENPMEWWMKEDVQRAVKTYADRFARVRSTWVDEWRQSISELMADHQQI